MVGRPHGSHGVLQVPFVLHVGRFHPSTHVGVTIGFPIDVLEVVGVSVVLGGVGSLLGPGLHLLALSLSEGRSVPGLVAGRNPLHGGLRGLRWQWRGLTVTV